MPNNEQKWRQVNKQTKQDNSKINLHLNHRIDTEIDYFIVGLEKSKRVAIAKATHKMHNDFSNIFAVAQCFKSTYSLQVKDCVKQYQVLPRDIALHYKNHSEKN